MNDPRETLDKAPMSLLQIMVVLVTCVLNGIDGFDVLSISFASNGIAEQFQVNSVALGVVLAMELVGMTIGSIALGGIADSFGRRRTSLFCMMIMSLGMFATPFVTAIPQLLACRVFTGIGLGGLLAAINAMAAEFANRKRRHLCVSIMSIGYPLGGVIGGIIVSQFFKGSWHSIFFFGCAVTTLFIPIVFFLVPESVHWLIRKQPKDALKRVNAALRRMGHSPVDELPAVSLEARKKTMKDLFSPGLVRITTIVTLAYFFHIITYYFILKWVPRAVHLFLHQPESIANSILVYANVGGAMGGIVFGLLTLRFCPKKLTIGTMAIGALFVAFFGSITPDDGLLYTRFFAGLCGFFGNTAIVGMFALFAHVFPTHLRASGTGFCVGLGRGAGMLSPIIVGYFVDRGFQFFSVTALISIGGIIGALILLLLKMPENEMPENAK